jgi:UDP-N-acetylmuramate dehydrogenase
LKYFQLINDLGSISNERDYPLSLLNRYGTGGNADLVVFPNNEEELKRVIKLIKGKYPFTVIGGGSNLLISDKGYHGVVISTKRLTSIEIKGCLLTADCGVKLKSVVEEMQNNSFSGLEFSVGIPATVGGAVCMNAGCYGKSVGDKIRYVVTDEKTYGVKECDFGYRKSRFLNSNEVILKACFNLRPEEQDYIEEKLSLYKSFRKNPKGKTCGSVFKNDGYFAGKIIDEVGLKGYRVGGAKISNEHANFIIAEKGATSTDIYNLIKQIKEKVYEKKQINLNEEIIYFGEF